jgi:hypothetical protein
VCAVDEFNGTEVWSRHGRVIDAFLHTVRA